MVETLGRGMYRVADERGHHVAFVAGPAEARWVFLDGEAWLVDVSPPDSRRRTRRQDTDVLSSPMPATVVKVHVIPGQHVRAGDVLIMLEAMKMELAIRAPRGATVGAVRCRVGEIVLPGVPLLDLT